MIKVIIFVQQGICFNYAFMYHKTVIKYYLLHLQMGDDMTQPY